MKLQEIVDLEIKILKENITNWKKLISTNSISLVINTYILQFFKIL
jgi:hypothetical protein